MVSSSPIVRNPPQGPKRHFCDPSVAVALLGADAAALRRDLGFTGQLFESQVVHDLRVMAQPLGGRSTMPATRQAVKWMPSFSCRTGTGPDSK
ncbi:DUF4143 domain-containing protein [Microbacterium oxydans]|nr:DUF4143 domain-containing protein [Microbacterium oxydans]